MSQTNLNQADVNPDVKSNAKSITRAFLGGTAVAFAMVGATLFWMSSNQNKKTIPTPKNAMPEQVISLPASSSGLSADQSALPLESIFSSSPKKVKSLSIETKAD